MITTIKSLNWRSAAFWSAVTGAVTEIMGILNVNKAMIPSVQNVLEAVGGLLIAIPVHHVVKAQVAASSSANPLPDPPVVPGA